MFLPFPILGTLAFDFRSWWRTLCLSTLLANLMAFVFETFQTRINPARTTDSTDLNANILGITLGLLVCVLIGLFRKK
jgi:glycopeptide antibiotics resistance protein